MIRGGRTGKVIVGMLGVTAAVAIGSCGDRGSKVANESASGKQAPKPASTQASPQASPPEQAARTRPEFRPEPCSPLAPTPSNREELASFARAKIPLVPGLILVEAWASRTGDREEITRVVSVDADAVRVSSSGTGASDKPMTATRTICFNDLLGGRTYVTEMGGYDPEIIHGATNFSLSRGLFKELRAGKAFFLYEEQIRMIGPDTYKSHSFPGTLARVEPEPVPLAMIVNDQRVDLPTIHARGELADTQAEIYVVDDVLNPVTLRYRMEDLKFGVDIVKISFPVEMPQLEQQLAEKGRVEVYGIYFDFASDGIRPESEPVLKEIADAMTGNPSWKLSVEGHTDNIGGDAYNLDLSRRRAEAVKQALVDRYHIAVERLSTVGVGASRPKESNDTLEGRARNRRVELVRQ